MHRTITPWLALIALLVAAFTLACRLKAPGAVNGGLDEPDAVLDSLLGGSRSFMGGLCFTRADLYLHRGQAHTETTAFTNRFFQRLGASVSPPQLEHRTGDAAMQEIMPWVSLAAGADPGNPEYVLCKVYMLRVAGRTDRALATLREARARMPDRPELTFDEARLHLEAKRWDECGNLLDACLRQLGPAPATDEDRLLLADVATLRGLLHERDGNIAPAAACFDLAVAMGPKIFTNLALRAAELRRGVKPADSAQIMLEQRSRAMSYVPCHHDEHADHDD